MVTGMCVVQRTLNNNLFSLVALQIFLLKWNKRHL